MATISRALAGVPDWEGLAASLSINSLEIRTDCAQELALARCYRRELVRRYCDSQQSADPRKVAEDMAAELERMGHARQGAGLRGAFSPGEQCRGIDTVRYSIYGRGVAMDSIDKQQSQAVLRSLQSHNLVHVFSIHFRSSCSAGEWRVHW